MIIIKMRNRKLTADEQIAILSDYKAGIKIKDIIEKFNISKPTLYRILKQYVN